MRNTSPWDGLEGGHTADMLAENGGEEYTFLPSLLSRNVHALRNVYAVFAREFFRFIFLPPFIILCSLFSMLFRHENEG